MVAAWVPLGVVLVAAFGSVWLALLLVLLAAVWSLVGADEGCVLAADALWSAGAVVVVVCVLAADALWSAGAVVVVVCVLAADAL